MAGLIRGVARTAVVAGTASSVTGRVQRRQAEKFATRDAQAEVRPQAAQQQTAPAPVPSPAAPPPGGDMVSLLKELAQLRDHGILTEEEFGEQKARILAG